MRLIRRLRSMWPQAWLISLVLPKFNLIVHIKLCVKCLVVSSWIDFLLWELLLFVALRHFCFENKSVKEPTLSKFSTARFKIFVDGRMLTISPFSGCPAFSMIDELTTLLTVTPHKKFLVSVLNYLVPVLYNYKTKMKRMFSRTR